MLAQIRIYTINKGEMDTFLKQFESEVMALHKQVDWPIVSTFINRPQNEFIWVRTHEDAADLETKTKAFFAARDAGNITLGGSVAKMEVREVELGPVG